MLLKNNINRNLRRSQLTKEFDRSLKQMDKWMIPVSSDLGPETFDVVNEQGQVTGKAYNINPVVLATDAECEQCLLQLQSDLTLSSDELTLVHRCLEIIRADVEDEIDFDTELVVDLAEMAVKYRERTNEITAISDHISQSIATEIETSENFYNQCFAAYSQLNEMISKMANGQSVDRYGVPLK